MGVRITGDTEEREIDQHLRSDETGQGPTDKCRVRCHSNSVLRVGFPVVDSHDCSRPGRNRSRMDERLAKDD